MAGEGKGMKGKERRDGTRTGGNGKIPQDEES